MHIKIASIMLVASILGLGALAPLTAQTSIAQQQDVISAIAGGFESISVVQNADTITITITKTGGEAPPSDNGTVPEGPIIILPPNNETGQNGTVIVPEPLPPTNETQAPTENQTAPPVEPPVIIVEPPGNVTQVEPPSNVTVIDNDTVVIAPPDQPVTETPGNVTVIDPPVTNATEPGIPEECGCPITDGNETAAAPGVSGGAPDIQFPGANITIENDTTIMRPDTEPGEESGNGNGNGDGNGG